MRKVRQAIGGLGNLMFKEAFIYAQLRKGNIPDLYVQGEKYWKEYKEEIKQRFGGGIGYVDKVALQIRRGDYMGNSFYADLTQMDYYQRATAMFPNEEFLVFCHDGQDTEQDEKDKEWCKNFLDEVIPYRYTINEPGEETEDLNKMASCKAKIIANSSFGWWSGFLGNGQVIAPKRWFADGIERVELPANFTKI